MSDLDSDGRVDPLMIWVDDSDRMTLTIAEVISTNLAFRTRVAMVLPGRVVRAASVGTPTMIRVLRAEFANATDARIWLGWINQDGFVEVELIELRGDLSEVVTLARYTFPTAVAAGDLRDRSGRFDLASGDFNGDGNDELAVLTTENIVVPNGLNNFQLYVRFFRYQEGAPALLNPDTVAAQDQVLYTKDGRSSLWLPRVAGYADDFDGDGNDELAVVYETTDNSSISRWFMQFVKPDAALSSVTKVPDRPEQIDQTNGSTGYPLDLQSGEFDGDPLPELVVGWRQVQLFDIRTNLTGESEGRDRTAARHRLESRDSNEIW